MIPSRFIRLSSRERALRLTQRKSAISSLVMPKETVSPPAALSVKQAKIRSRREEMDRYYARWRMAQYFWAIS